MKNKFNSDEKIPVSRIIEIPIMTIVITAVFTKITRIAQVFLDECLYETQKKSKNELKEIDIKNRMCYFFDDIISGSKISFSNISLDKKLYEQISVYNISYKTPTGPKPLRITFDKIDGFIMVLDSKIKHLVLFDYGLFDKICDKIKYLISKKVLLQILLIIILVGSELIHIILYQLKRY